MSNDKQIMVVNEKWYESWVKDGFTFTGLGGLAYFNKNYLGDSGVLGFMILAMFLISMLGKAMKSGITMMTDEEVIEYLSTKHNIESGVK